MKKVQKFHILQVKSKRLPTTAKTEMIYLKNEGASIAMNSTENESSTSMAIEEIKILDAFWSYQQNSTANPAHLTQNWAKLAKSAVPFSW